RLQPQIHAQGRQPHPRRDRDPEEAATGRRLLRRGPRRLSRTAKAGLLVELPGQGLPRLAARPASGSHLDLAGPEPACSAQERRHPRAGPRLGTALGPLPHHRRSRPLGDGPHSMLMLRRLIQLFGGIAVFGLAIALIVRADLGLDPWNVLNDGVAARTPLSYGVVMILL